MKKQPKEEEKITQEDLLETNTIEIFLVNVESGNLLDVSRGTEREITKYNSWLGSQGAVIRWMSSNQYFDFYVKKNSLYAKPMYTTDLGLYELIHQETFETLGKRWMLPDMAKQFNNSLETKGDLYRWILIGSFEELAWGGLWKQPTRKQ